MEEKEFNSINVIPLVDIMLVLLTIVLTTATFIVQGSIPVNLPTAGKQAERSLRSVDLFLTKEGKIIYSDRELSSQELQTLISSLSPETNVNLYADRDASVQSLVSLIDLLKKHNLQRLSIKTQAIR
ncbi:MAG: biopolymer transporter ExbD [Aquificaceae bacterium]|nr:biopolymer transporter ExbD [Aquificaceae bacterium]